MVKAGGSIWYRMRKKTDHKRSSKMSFVKPMTREEIIDAALDHTKPLFKEKKKQPKAKPKIKPDTMSFEKIAESLDIWPGTGAFRLFKIFFENKKPKKGDCKTFAPVLANLSDEQLEILKLLCSNTSFPVKHILDFSKNIKKFGLNRLLVLRAFVDLEGLSPGFLNQFFRINLPKGDRKKMGYDAWEEELKEKHITHDQMNVFYNICTRIPGITPKTAIAVLPKIRKLRQQHAVIINHFLKEGVKFGEKTIDDKTILGLINLWLVMPEMENKSRLKPFIKKIRRKPEDQREDFKFIIHSFKIDLEKGKKNSLENVVFDIRSFFDL